MSDEQKKPDIRKPYTLYPISYTLNCPQCELKNAEGAFYCARCHAALPRPLAPKECAFCGYIPFSEEPHSEICPMCGSDEERGKEVRERRITSFQSEFLMKEQDQNAQMRDLKRQKSVGCLPILGMIILTIILFFS